MASVRSTPAAIARTGRVALTKHRARAEVLLALVARLTATIGRSFYELGKALQEIHDDKLHVALGLRSFDALLAERVGIAHSTAYELIAIARKVPKKLATHLGPAKAYDLVRYAEADHQTVATVAKRPIAKAPAQTIRAATRERATKGDPAKQRATVAAKQMEHRLDRAGATASVAVHARGKLWRLVVELAVEDAMLVAPKA